MPVFAGSLDHVTGIAFARDLLQVLDTDAVHKTVAELQRPTEFVPETKKVAELLREMQQEKQHMRMVIDEYGGVAGLVTIEDLLEAIVGSIADEHDEAEEVNEPVRESEGVRGAGKLRSVAAARAVCGAVGTGSGRRKTAKRRKARLRSEGRNGAPRLTLHLPQHYEATTLGGLVSEIAGHIPLPGEVVAEDGLRMEVLASTDRKVERVRVELVETAEE